MAIANPRLHIICGVCGSNKHLQFEIATEINTNPTNDEDYLKTYVAISCNNCSSITYLDEVIPEIKTDYGSDVSN